MVQCDECSEWVTKACGISIEGLGEMEGLFCTEQCARVKLERNISFSIYEKHNDEFKVLEEHITR